MLNVSIYQLGIYSNYIKSSSMDASSNNLL